MQDSEAFIVMKIQSWSSGLWHYMW